VDDAERDSEIRGLRQKFHDLTSKIGVVLDYGTYYKDKAEILRDIADLDVRLARVETEQADLVKIKVAVLGALVTGLVGIILGLTKGGL